MIENINTNYVLITPARNEEHYIENTINSVICQTLLPNKWVIVNDGSTDRTADIILKYTSRHNFIEIISVDCDRNRNFGSKAKSIKAAYNKLKNLDFDFIGNLDADVSFEPDYFENIIKQFAKNKRLGIAGGLIFDFDATNNKKLDFTKQSVSTNWSVSGAIQLFRKQCYEDIGGYVIAKRGIDAIAETMARMHGWEVRSFSEYKVMHHRTEGTATQGILSARLNLGVQDYALGYSPLFELVRCTYRSFNKPYIFGSITILLGYILAMLRRDNIIVPDDFVNFLRQEQIGRLKNLLKKFT